ncbi:MAG TPA: nuclear transport factor 2 family protein [Cyclobacteriaceae bacterium]|nr:nuclear transport factor 2 family protein [Cyclobacteriaceae bacterium]
MKNDSNQYSADEKAIRERVEEYAAAIRGKDLEKVMAIFAPDHISFDLEAPLQHMGAEAKRKNWTNVFAAYQYPLGYEIRDLTLVIENTLAVGRSLNRISGLLSNGRKTGYWVRWTTCFQKKGDTWFLIHDHVSVPLDVATGKGVLNIEP